MDSLAINQLDLHVLTGTVYSKMQISDYSWLVEI